MAKIIKQALDGLRSRVHKHPRRALSVLEQKVGAAEDALRRTQYEIAHDHTKQMDEIVGHVINSGIIALSETEIIAKIFTGLKMYLDPRDMAITPHLALDSIWEPEITKAWLKVVRPTDTVLDIGSNNGYYGALAAQRTDKKMSRVVLFEANPNLIPYIRKTLSVNWLNEQCVLENLAVGDKRGTVTLNILRDYIGSSSVHSNEKVSSYMGGKMHLKTEETVRVESVDIDSYCAEHDIAMVNVIIMDIEGFEEKAYAGMRKTIASSPDITLFIEFTKGGYTDPKGFYEQMLDDFGNVYVVDSQGKIVKPKEASYESIIGDSDDWVMPVFSKRSDLHGA